MSKHLHLVLGKLLYVALFVTIQVAALIVIFLFFRDQFAYFYIFCMLLSLGASFHILNNTTSNPAYKIAWLIPILLFPIFGGLLYLLFGKYRMTRKQRASSRAIRKQIATVMESEHIAADHLETLPPDAAIQARYLLRASGSPPCVHTQTEYLPIGEAFFDALLRELETAESFIFLEYFIVEEGTMWNSILEVLERKIKQGVEVRLMYDDLGCLLTLPRHYDRVLRAKGLRVCVFNPFNSVLSPRFNNRDHRKICIIDGKIGFTGGINLADEYINAYAKHGHWKDTGVCLRGSAVWSMTVQYLALWGFTSGQVDSFSHYCPPAAWVESIAPDGVVLPYTDLPLDDDLVGETAYLNMIHRAKKYVYITTPYLIIDNEMMTSLCTAAKAGIDVRIITPHIPDKKTVFFLTRSYYEPLQKAGVHIYEYTPGFIHAKTMVCDDEYAIVGTINLDYRSLYLHLEDAVWMYRSSAVSDVKQDFLRTQEISQEMHPEDLGRIGWLKQLWLGILHAFAPLV